MQVFDRSVNTVTKVTLWAMIAGPALLLVAASAMSRSPIGTKATIPIEQPVPFSHEHHSSELGIDCRYCHQSVETSSSAGYPPTHTCMSCHSQIWTSSPLLAPVRNSYATVEPIRWHRVNAVPDFVYFNHSAHLRVGLNCNLCHGPVQRMQLAYKGQPFFMSWCLECHRRPENFVAPRGSVFNVYGKFQQGMRLTSEERAIQDGGTGYQRSGSELQAGRDLVQQYHIPKSQLTDCWVCHR